MFDPRILPTVNASLNALATVLLVVGYLLVRARRLDAHRRVMIGALTCSALFLVSYLVYHAEVGSVRFQGTGPVRTLYFAILISHTILAATLPILAPITVVRALRSQFPRHRQIARYTLPIWLYVSVTGVVVYWMLYRMGYGAVPVP